MAGIPVRSAEVYINKLLEAGYKVAICDQTDEKESRTLLKRVVTEVITPGTITSESLLPEDTNNYLAGYNEAMGESSLVLVDVSSGDVFYIYGDKEKVWEEVERLNIKEIVLPKGKDINIGCTKTFRDKEEFSSKVGYDMLKDIFGRGADIPPLVLSALGGVLSYLKEKKGDAIKHLQFPTEYPISEYIPLDRRTIETLGLVGERSLYSLLNMCLTPMGKRSLRFSILHPYNRIDKINSRLRRVEYFYKNVEISQFVEDKLGKIYDFERELSRIASKKISPKNLVRFKESLRHSMDILDRLGAKYDKGIKEVCEYIERTIYDDPPADTSDGGYIRDGVNQYLDELRKVQRNSEEMLKDIERREREKTGISNLRIGYNSVFGYYIEVSRAQAKKVPEYYHRKQTLTNTERFTTDELQNIENLLLSHLFFL